MISRPYEVVNGPLFKFRSEISEGDLGVRKGTLGSDLPI